MAAEESRVKETIVTEELYDMIIFLVHSFVRPIETEFYALKHKHVSITKDPRALLLTIADGKTGFRLSNTVPAAVTVYERIKRRNPDIFWARALSEFFSGLLSCSLSRAQTRSLVSGFRRIELQAIRRALQEAETEDAG